jgi:hypothetical protein
MPLTVVGEGIISVKEARMRIPSAGRQGCRMVQLVLSITEGGLKALTMLISAI